MHMCTHASAHSAYARLDTHSVRMHAYALRMHSYLCIRISTYTVHTHAYAYAYAQIRMRTHSVRTHVRIVRTHVRTHVRIVRTHSAIFVFNKKLIHNFFRTFWVYPLIFIQRKTIKIYFKNTAKLCPNF